MKGEKGCEKIKKGSVARENEKRCGVSFDSCLKKYGEEKVVGIATPYFGLSNNVTYHVSL